MFLPEAMHVRHIETYEYLYLSAFIGGGGVFKGNQSSVHTALQKVTDKG